DPVRAHDAGREIADQPARLAVWPRIALGDPVGLDHQPAGALRPCRGKLRRADLADELGPFLAQGLELAQATLVAAAAGGDPAGKPTVLALDALAQTARLGGLGLDDRPRPFLEGSIAAIEHPASSPVEPDRFRAEPRQERPVMADQKERACV